MQLDHDNREVAGHAACLEVLEAGLGGADAEGAVRRAVEVDDGRLVVRGRREGRGAVAVDGAPVEVDLADVERVWVLGAGKAGSPMLSGLEALLGERIYEGIVAVKDGYRKARSAEVGASGSERVDVVEAGHPVPDVRSKEAAQRALSMARRAGPRDLVLCPISGGGSALWERPVDGVTLEDLGRVSEALVTSGAPIQSINAVRKHLSAIKGGQLARAAAPARVVTVVVSDVLGNPLDTIASGPTVGDTTTFADALAVIEEAGLGEELPRRVVAHLEAGARGEVAETPRPDSEAVARARAAVLADRRDAVEAARRHALERGWAFRVRSTTVQGEAREAGRAFVEDGLAVAAATARAPICVLGAGEPTVTVTGDGLGGRNQEFALGAALALDATEEPAAGAAVVGALATDGTDGPAGDRHGAAGGIVDVASVARAVQAGLDPREALADNDTYPLLAATGDLLVHGPTFTNVNDLYCMIVGTRTRR